MEQRLSFNNTMIKIKIKMLGLFDKMIRSCDE